MKKRLGAIHNLQALPLSAWLLGANGAASNSEKLRAEAALSQEQPCKVKLKLILRALQAVFRV